MKSFLLFFLLLLPSAFGATITGTVYDLDLQEVGTAVVTIDTQPEQRVVAKDGSYSFNVPAGEYYLIASATIEGEAWSSEENVTATGEGEYTLDLILFPSFAELDDLDLGVEEPVEFDENGGSLLYLWLLLIGVVALVGIAVFYSRMMAVKAPLVNEDEFRAAVLKLLKKHHGRISQRDLRRELPFSEAKVSLVLTELENEGIVKKIKKGRGNVIVKQ